MTRGSSQPPVERIEPLRLSFEVACSAAHAFDVWTRRIATWWPSSHSVSGDAGLIVTLEPRLGGRIFERTPLGLEHDWGEVTHWEPPTHLGYLWHIMRDRADATDVAITFVELEGGRTRVDIVHSGWERLGAEAQSWRDRNHAGWSGVLPPFVVAAESTSSETAASRD